MVFSEPAFLFYFLPVVIALYGLFGWRTRIWFFVGSGIAFFSAAGMTSLLLIILLICVSFLFGRLFDSRLISSSPFLSRVILPIGITFCFVPLIIFKYAGFLITEFEKFTHFEVGYETNFILPLAISFYTFQCASYLIESHSSVSTKVNHSPPSFTIFAAYILFFPQLIAGPIVRLEDVYSQLLKEENLSWLDFRAGAHRFSLGLSKKVLIGDNAGRLVGAVMSSPEPLLTSVDVFVLLFGVTVQIYFDFSGYSDMAIGLARIFGVRLNENFRRPYSATSVTDFWRRWHISLSTWFRDYLYVPLGGNRRSNRRTWLNLAIVFTVTGLWHGAAWTFLLWGWFHGIALVLERIGGRRRRRPCRRSDDFLGRARTLIVVMFGWLIFFAGSLEQFVVWVFRLFPTSLSSFGLSPLVWLEVDIFSVGALSIGSFLVVFSGKVSLGERLERFGNSVRGFDVAISAMLVLSCLRVLSSSFTPFIYFQF